MAKFSIKIPGPGGSLGECAICGKTFTTEIILGQSVPSFRVDMLDADLPAHKDCLEVVKKITDGDWRKVPEGPIRRFFADCDAERQSANPEGSV